MCVKMPFRSVMMEWEVNEVLNVIIIGEHFSDSLALALEIIVIL